ncbi:hypothetical protein KCP77_08190 [Salmonella enterica subsp. enterica]|nr:hypothetical protein KCP77_08190 [Salmonella enterica subsp. enterica]
MNLKKTAIKRRTGVRHYVTRHTLAQRSPVQPTCLIIFSWVHENIDIVLLNGARACQQPEFPPAPSRITLVDGARASLRQVPLNALRFPGRWRYRQ